MLALKVPVIETNMFFLKLTFFINHFMQKTPQTKFYDLFPKYLDALNGRKSRCPVN